MRERNHGNVHWNALSYASDLRQDVMDSLDKEFYSLKEAAKLLKRNYDEVCKAADKGEIRTVRMGKGGSIRKIPKKEIAWLLVPSPLEPSFGPVRGDFLRANFQGGSSPRNSGELRRHENPKPGA